MKPEYAEWVADFRRHNGWLRGRCQSATKAMCKAFPELKPVAGWANGEEHWWCVSPDGAIVDPTASQFLGDEVEYRAFKPGDTVRVGTCVDCGDGIYKAVDSLNGAREMFCDARCEQSYRAYLLSGADD